MVRVTYAYELWNHLLVLDPPALMQVNFASFLSFFVCEMALITMPFPSGLVRIADVNTCPVPELVLSSTDNRCFLN